jgi:hypothetical protein
MNKETYRKGEQSRQKTCRVHTTFCLEISPSLVETVPCSASRLILRMTLSLLMNSHLALEDIL